MRGEPIVRPMALARLTLIRLASLATFSRGAGEGIYRIASIVLCNSPQLTVTRPDWYAYVVGIIIAITAGFGLYSAIAGVLG